MLTSVTLPPVADNTLFQDQTSNSNGAGPYVFAGETSRGFGARRGLLKFDVAGSVPAGAHVDSATLQLHVSKDLGSTNNFGVYLVKADWGEGTSNSGDPGGDGAPATTNDATWTDRFFNAVPAQRWASAGGDFNSTASAVTSVGGVKFYQWSSAQLATDVQNWLDSPSTQFGWLIKAVDESVTGTAQRFESRQNPNVANRPILTINYTIPNQPPTLDAIADPAAILEDASLQTINLSNITAGAGESQTLRVTATSDNTTLIPTPTVVYTSPSTTGSLNYSPATDRFGSAKITVTVRDAGPDSTFDTTDDATISQTFTVNVTPVNDAPTLAAINNPPAILEDAAQQTINLTGISAGPFETQFLTVTATSDNPGLIPNPTVTYASPNSFGSIAYKPVANQSGTAVITVKVQDDGGTGNNGVDTLTRTFTVTVTPVNDAPTLDVIADPAAILQDSGEQTVNLTGISAGPFESQVLTIFASSDNSALIPDPLVAYSNPNASGSLSYTPAPGQTGSAVITVTIRDSGLNGISNDDDDQSFARIFTVRVISPDEINHAPSFTKGSDSSATDEDGPVTIPQWAIDIVPGPPQESWQTVSFFLSTDNGSLFASNPAVDKQGTLTFTPKPNAHGTTHVSVQIKDNGGTAGGGIDISQPQIFDITIIKKHRLHNAAETGPRNGLDVTGSTSLAPDGFIVAGDVLAVINYINAKGSGPIDNVSFGPPYCDVNGDDEVVAGDALTIINYINAGNARESEASASILLDSNSDSSDLFSLLALDVVEQGVGRRRLK